MLSRCNALVKRVSMQTAKEPACARQQCLCILCILTMRLMSCGNQLLDNRGGDYELCIGSLR